MNELQQTTVLQIEVVKKAGQLTLMARHALPIIKDPDGREVVYPDEIVKDNAKLAKAIPMCCEGCATKAILEFVNGWHEFNKLAVINEAMCGGKELLYKPDAQPSHSKN